MTHRSGRYDLGIDDFVLVRAENNGSVFNREQHMAAPREYLTRAYRLIDYRNDVAVPMPRG